MNFKFDINYVNCETNTSSNDLPKAKSQLMVPHLHVQL